MFETQRPRTFAGKRLLPMGSLFGLQCLASLASCLRAAVGALKRAMGREMGVGLSFWELSQPTLVLTFP